MGKKKSKGKPVVDGIDTAPMTRKDLVGFARKLVEETERECEERKMFLLERDKLRTFWTITRTQLEEVHAQIRNKEREVEVAQDLAEIEIKNVVQQTKHLQYENQNRIADMRANMMTQLKIAQENHGLQEQELMNDNRELMRLIRNKEEITELQVQEMKMKLTEILSEERQKFTEESQEITKLYEKRMDAYILDEEAKHHTKIEEMEQQKNAQLSDLIAANEKSFNDLRNYYNDITQNNLALISSMKEHLEELRKAGERNKRIVSDATIENKKLLEPLQDARSTATELKSNLTNYAQDKKKLAMLKVRYNKRLTQLDGIQWEWESLKMQHAKLTEEKLEYKKKLEKAVLEMQQISSLKNSLLERKMKHIEKQSEKQEAVLGEMLSAAGVEQQNYNVRVEKLIAEKNEIIADLHYELARVSKAHDELLTTMKARMLDNGIPIDELGFRTMSVQHISKLGACVAGLIGAQKS